jgi:DNA-binding GntR family transcriptional regulator
MKIDKHSILPLYIQIKNHLLTKIESGEYKTGSKIPSENELCEEFNLSRPTVRQAISELVFEGKLQIIKGKGTFVFACDFTVPLHHFNCFTFSLFSKNEIRIEEYDCFELANNVKKDIMDQFDENTLREGLYIIQKPYKQEEMIYAYTESYIPVVYFPNLLQDLKVTQQMIDLTVNKYAYLPAKGNCTLYVLPADASISSYLDISRGAPVLTAHSRLISKSEAITEVIYAYMRSDVCKIVI